MRRRELLGTVCLCSMFAGCGNDRQDSTTAGAATDSRRASETGPGTGSATATRTSETGSSTGTEPATATPVRYRPVVTAVSLVSVWGPDGEERARIRRETYREANEAGSHIWEAAAAFDTGEWGPGEYRADVGIGNLELHRVSEPVTMAFAVEPE